MKDVKHAVDDLKRAGRDAEVEAKRRIRDLDGHDVVDDVKNAGDEVRRDIGNAGDEIRRDIGNAGDELRRHERGTSTETR
jgi:hypothetical protein